MRRYCLLQVCSSKVQPTDHEQSVISALNSASGSSDVNRLRKKRKKPKGPNPLSVKKSRKVLGVSRGPSGGGMSQSKVSQTQCDIAQYTYIGTLDTSNNQDSLSYM